MYAQEEDARVEAVPIFGGDEVDVGEFGRREEQCPGHFGVENDGVGVKPAIIQSKTRQHFCTYRTSRLKRERKKNEPSRVFFKTKYHPHNPPRPLPVRLSHLPQQQQLQIRNLVKLRPPI